MTSFKTTTLSTFLNDVRHLGAMDCSVMYATGCSSSAISRNNRLSCGRVNENLGNWVRTVCTLVKDMSS